MLYGVAYNMIMKQIIYYTTSDNKCPYLDWYNSLDKSIRKRIDMRIDKLEEGHYGNYKCISNDLFELRCKFGSGYRIYFTEEENIIILILCAGDKSTQKTDIQKAKDIIKEIKE
jgi:putative addiction module killer protein